MKESDVMRLWHYALLPYLPDAQFKGQLRELIAIMHDWRDRGQTNHLLINRVMDYPKRDLFEYYLWYEEEYEKRYNKELLTYYGEFYRFCENEPPLHIPYKPYYNWHNKEYLRICMCNLAEKHIYGKGKSRITDEEWQKLCDGYREITGEEYTI